jgi:hypothetical protein
VTPRKQLEYAAKACGYMVQPGHVGPEYWAGWNPRTDDGDSDRMACKLRIDIYHSKDFVRAVNMESIDYFARVAHNNTDEDVCRAVREARLLVAAEIGKGMK